MDSPPCRCPNRAFIAPTTSSPQAVQAALRMCSWCPLKRQCALEGLEAGTTLDGSWIAPPAGVILGGVICRGDTDTATALAAVAGVQVPTTYRQQRRKNRAPSHCRECGSPMTKWSRDLKPAGVAVHHARGYCTGCRAAYQRHLQEVGPRRVGLTKLIDRKRHHPETAAARARTAARRQHPPDHENYRAIKPYRAQRLSPLWGHHQSNGEGVRRLRLRGDGTVDLPATTRGQSPTARWRLQGNGDRAQSFPLTLGALQNKLKEVLRN